MVMIDRKCKNCKKWIQVRSADIKRGWGKFCSKSCKAKKQSKSMPFDKNAQRSYKPLSNDGTKELNYFDEIPDLNDHDSNISIEQDYMWTNH